jgi:uncharacterized membrane protein YiaA
MNQVIPYVALAVSVLSFAAGIIVLESEASDRFFFFAALMLIAGGAWR